MEIVQMIILKIEIRILGINEFSPKSDGKIS